MAYFSAKVCEKIPDVNEKEFSCKEIEVEISENFNLFGNYPNDLLFQYWTVGFSSVVFFYCVSLGVGKVLKFIDSLQR